MITAVFILVLTDLAVTAAGFYMFSRQPPAAPPAPLVAEPDNQPSLFDDNVAKAMAAAAGMANRPAPDGSRPPTKPMGL